MLFLTVLDWFGPGPRPGEADGVAGDTIDQVVFHVDLAAEIVRVKAVAAVAVGVHHGGVVHVVDFVVEHLIAGAG